jgi:hypothetical protein
MLSYAQNCEDIRLSRCFAADYRGTYVDVGAAGPVQDNATYFFYERGWRGLNVEPVPERCAELAWVRPRDVSLNLAAGARQGSVTLYRTRGAGGLSTMVEAIGALPRRT